MCCKQPINEILLDNSTINPRAINESKKAYHFSEMEQPLLSIPLLADQMNTIFVVVITNVKETNKENEKRESERERETKKMRQRKRKRERAVEDRKSVV